MLHYSQNISDGKVCMKPSDNGKPATSSINGVTSTYVLTCDGTYKEGKLTYSKIVTSEIIKYSSICDTYTNHTPYVILNMQGTFDSSTGVQGTLTSRLPVSDCNILTGSITVSHDPTEGTWTGTISQ